MATQIIRVDKKELVKPFLNYCLTNLQGNRNFFFLNYQLKCISVFNWSKKPIFITCKTMSSSN